MKMKENIKKIGFKPSTLPQIEVIDLSHLIKKHLKELTSPHRTEFYHIFIFRNCQPQHWIDFNPISVQPYSLLFIDKGRAHQFDSLASYDGTLIVFTDSFYAQTESDIKFLNNNLLFNDLNDNCLLSLNSETIIDYLNISEQIQKEFLQLDPHSTPTIQKNLLHNLLLLAEREKRRQGYIAIQKDIDFEYSQLFKGLLEQSFKTHKSVMFYAKALAVSERRLGQATAKILGKLPKEVINDRILVETKRLLAYDNHSIKEIAHELGFEEPTNFIKFFKKYTAETPLEFREKHVKPE